LSASMSQSKRKARVALKYCGSCNPYVDLIKIAHRLAEMAEQRRDFQLVPISEEAIDVVVILCGCPRACGNKEEVRARAREILVIAGYSIGGRPVPDSCLLSTFEIELSSILERSKLS